MPPSQCTGEFVRISHSAFRAAELQSKNAAAIREFKEETGSTPRGEFIELGAIKQKGGKIVHAWAFSGDWDGSQPLKSNTFELEWPPGSGSVRSFPEIDRVGFFSMPEACKKLKESQHPFLDRLQAALKDRQNL